MSYFHFQSSKYGKKNRNLGSEKAKRSEQKLLIGTFHAFFHQPIHIPGLLQATHSEQTKWKKNLFSNLLSLK